MDSTTARLVDFITRTDYAQLSAQSVRDCKLRLIDTLGCALGAYDEPLSVMARAVAGRARGAPAARVWGADTPSTPEFAAFANGVMLRLLDISDTYLGKSRGHPSDVAAAVLAAADVAHASGADLIVALALAYDVYCSLCNAHEWNAKGWDQPVYGVLGAVAGAGKLLGLSREQMGEAIALALVPNMAMIQTRRGPLSSWKGCAGANASRNAVFAAMLARDGFTGPSAIFEGECGLFDIAGRFEWNLPAPGEMIGRTHIKSLPVCYHGQSAVLLALDMRKRYRASEIAEIRVDAYRTAVDMMGNDPSRWAPTTHETADHSLPYTVAIAFLDGRIGPDSFASERFTDPAVVDLMHRIKVNEDPALSRAYPEGAPSRLTVVTRSGAVHVAEMTYPAGHAKRPMSADDVERKFRDMLSKHPLAAARCDEILQRLWALEQLRDAGAEAIDLLA
ncbi:MAG: MmgE/PrpD family protein [Burkholderiales bacterium]|nr:MmgE/PrpD family protein [Burkholderiales bacterium]